MPGFAGVEGEGGAAAGGEGRGGRMVQVVREIAAKGMKMAA